MLAQLRKDEKRNEAILAGHSERDRQRILDAYDEVIAEIRRSYPKLAKSALVPPNVTSERVPKLAAGPPLRRRRT